jgi:hypothetical protein
MGNCGKKSQPQAQALAYQPTDPAAVEEDPDSINQSVNQSSIMGNYCKNPQSEAPAYHPTDPAAAEEDAAAARRRIEEEMQKIQSSTNHNRIAKQKALIGEQAEPVGARKKGVAQSLEDFNKKGTNTTVDTSDIAVEIGAVKKEYSTNLDRFNAKGKSAHPTTESGALPDELHSKFEKEKNVPTLFAATPYKVKGAAAEAESPAPEAALDTSGKHVAALAALRPKGWDGVTYHSLVDLRQRRVEGIDMKNREQYLSPEEFQKTFKMTKGEFAVCPKWKRDKLKGGLHLH